MTPSRLLPRLAPATLRRRLSVLRWVRAVAFWCAVALPFVYLPLLAAGLDTVARTAAFLGLLALNALTLVVSHSYRPG